MTDSPIPAAAGNDQAPTPLQRTLERLRPYLILLAPLSFAAGLASFLLIERQEWLAQWLTVLMLLVWLMTLAEGVLGRWLQQVRWLRLSPLLLRLGTQATHQEAFFFTLPFFLHTTDWGTGQAWFTGLVIAAAAASMWDPFYFGTLAARRWLYLLYHVFAIFVVSLTVGPILLHVTTTQTVALAAVAIAVLSVPSLAQIMDRRRWYHWVLMPVAAATLGAIAWWARPWVPPATLWLGETAITLHIFAGERRPGAALTVVPPAQVHAQGLYAFTAIRAPRGLHEQVVHRWVHNGREVDRIPMQIVGGRKEGYRAWSYKKGFPADPRGVWAVQVVTEGGQLIGQVRFTVGGGPVATPVPEAVPGRVPEDEAELPAQETLPEAPPELEEEPVAEEPEPESEGAAEEDADDPESLPESGEEQDAPPDYDGY